MEHLKKLYNNILITPSIFILITILSSSNGSELRPSDHGLAFQETSTPTGNDVPEMLSFFNGKNKTVAPLPVAKNVTAVSGTWWKSDGTDGKSRGDSKGEHVRLILLLAAVAFGLTGIVLLLTSAVVFVWRYRKGKWNEEEEEEEEERSASAAAAGTTALVSNADVKVEVL